MSLASGLIREGKEEQPLALPSTWTYPSAPERPKINARSRTQAHARTPYFREHISDITVIVFKFRVVFEYFVLNEAILWSDTGRKDLLPGDRSGTAGNGV
jgi:hypothetical protein